ncbi:MAG: response regulator [Ghiorsea sp.]
MTMQVLLVEDNPDDQLLAKRVIRDHGTANYELHIVDDGQKALTWLYDTPKATPDLIVLDLNLPKVSGLDVLKRIRQEKATQCTPVVILTTSDEESDIKTSYERGANSYIKKPVNFNEFSHTWKFLDEYWLQVNTAPVK